VGRFVRATRANADVLPPTRAEVLAQLERDGPCSIAELAARRGVRHQTMSRMVADLEQLDLVARAKLIGQRRRPPAYDDADMDP
jgi:DNA-binding MarR family transcriptional regulator